MTRFIGRRLLRGVLLFFATILLVFFVTHIIGDPVGRSLPLDATPAQRASRAVALGLDRPLSEQFTEYFTGAIRFDFGDSFRTRTPAMETVLQAVPRSLLLVGAGMALAGVLGISLGIALGLTERPWFSQVGNSVSLVALSVPQFWIGILFILVFAVHLGWFPTSGVGSWRHLVLPALTLSLVTGGRIAQLTSATLRDELAKPYIRTARAKGMSTRRVVVHGLRNTMVPVTTVFAYEAVTALAGYTILVETVFAWPGVGWTITQAVKSLDLPLTAATAVTIALMVIVANALVDILYRTLDPRIAAET
jgi:peptide/nickel transport system permease protein